MLFRVRRDGQFLARDLRRQLYLLIPKDVVKGAGKRNCLELIFDSLKNDFLDNQ
jgi:hypothetical protein